MPTIVYFSENSVPKVFYTTKSESKVELLKLAKFKMVNLNYRTRNEKELFHYLDF